MANSFNNRPDRLSTFLALLVIIALVCSLVMTGVALFVRSTDSMRNELVNLGLEDAARRIEESGRKQADIDAIVRTARIGRDGRVRIVPLTELQGVPLRGQYFERDAAGVTRMFADADCAGYRIIASIPILHPFFSDRDTFDALIVLDIILVIIFLLAMPAIRVRIKQDFSEVKTVLFGGGGGRISSFFRMFTTPIALATFLGFALVLVGIYFGNARIARRNAELRLEAAAEDIVDELDDCVGRQLAFVGKTICEHYGSPEAMTNVDMRAIMNTYGLDELNAVDARGIVVASMLPIVGDDQWKKTNPAKFNQALLKEKRAVFSQCFRTSADEPGVWYKYVGVAFPPPAQGYLQLGFCRARMQSSFDYTLRELVNSWHIGERGFFIISKTSNGEILSTLDPSLSGQTLASVGFDVFTARLRTNIDRRDPVSQDFLGFASLNFFESDFQGERYLCTSGVVNQFHRYVAAIPLSEVQGPARRNMLMTCVLLFITLIVVDAFIMRLSNLVGKLRHFIQADAERQQQDLTLARTIQVSSLPLTFPDESDYRIFARMDTAREVGGDFYDFYSLPTGEIAFLIADVSGKGVPASLFMMRAKAIIRATIFAHPGDLAAAVAEANDALAEKNDAEMFVTAWIGVFDRKERRVTFVNAGHNPPLVKRASGSVEWLRSRGGTALAAIGGRQYRTGEVHLGPGDSLFLYTDGVSEAMNGSGAQYGDARLEQALRENTDGNIVSAVRTDVTLFVAGAEPSDDITMLALDLKP